MATKRKTQQIKNKREMTKNKNMCRLISESIGNKSIIHSGQEREEVKSRTIAKTAIAEKNTTEGKISLSKDSLCRRLIK